MGWGKRRVFLEFGQCQLSLWFLREGEFPLSLKGELGHSRILRSLYSNGLKNQRVNFQFGATRGLFGTNLSILNLDQMMKTAPKLVPRHQTSMSHQRKNV
ncbi:hypothetical protein AVEN_31117-1 [Araneus ventricosus]|uniref:Uncharacterized protein n=1 Tax=Araneus ventricosus TaxID=182803 RepID=A0A4Y2VID2_ARAVE|nr:hypothetical protein AVEN_31117-1 [Araneus ventricosus]